jgi:toxin FitB
MTSTLLVLACLMGACGVGLAAAAAHAAPASSVLVLAEIRRGIELKRRNDPQQAKSLDRWFSQMRTRLGDRVLPIDEPIAEAWALLGIPNPLPLIDGLLAATAKVHGLTFVTRNVVDISVAGVSFLDPFSVA